jgi:hypothetical protein
LNTREQEHNTREDEEQTEGDRMSGVIYIVWFVHAWASITSKPKILTSDMTLSTSDMTLSTTAAVLSTVAATACQLQARPSVTFTHCRRKGRIGRGVMKTTDVVAGL